MMPTVREQLKKGESFLLIHKSKPIATIKPLEDSQALEEASDEDFELAALNDFLPDEDYLTEEEMNHYLSLKDPRKL